MGVAPGTALPKHSLPDLHVLEDGINIPCLWPGCDDKLSARKGLEAVEVKGVCFQHLNSFAPLHWRELGRDGVKGVEAPAVLSAAVARQSLLGIAYRLVDKSSGLVHDEERVDRLLPHRAVAVTSALATVESAPACVASPASAGRPAAQLAAVWMWAHARVRAPLFVRSLGIPGADQQLHA
eukprot:scaffold4521_cov388-Prasinococcus_capsulatus_cf.AAC.5